MRSVTVLSRSDWTCGRVAFAATRNTNRFVDKSWFACLASFQAPLRVYPRASLNQGGTASVCFAPDRLVRGVFLMSKEERI